jgi:protein-L-isoaspartate(D-aspartate) O-methyltransferase
VSDDWSAESERMIKVAGPMPSAVARVMRRVPRHRFVPANLRSMAYEDEPLPLPFGEATISAPHMVACQLEWAELTPGLSVLEVGSGSGYLLALLAELVRPGGTVLGVELDAGLVRISQRALGAHDYPEVAVRQGDGSVGAPDLAPFDRIVVSAATPEIEPAWKAQVRAHGTVTAPVGNRFEQVLVRWRNTGGEGTWDEGPACRFVPLQSRPVRVI